MVRVHKILGKEEHQIWFCDLISLVALIDGNGGKRVIPGNKIPKTTLSSGQVPSFDLFQSTHKVYSEKVKLVRMLGGLLNLISVLLKVPLEIGLSQSGIIPRAFTEPFVGRISIALAQEKCPVILVKTALRKPTTALSLNHLCSLRVISPSAIGGLPMS
jgi:hypothetical protein